MLATCLSKEALNRPDIELFEKAQMALKQALDAEWTWERGHLFQIDLFIFFGKQAEPIKNYEQIGLNDESKNIFSEKMIKIILLTEKFKENPPLASTLFASDTVFLTVLKNFRILFVGFPLLLWAIYEVPNISLRIGDKNSILVPFVFLILSSGVFVLILISMYLYRKSNKNEKG